MKCLRFFCVLWVVLNGSIQVGLAENKDVVRVCGESFPPYAYFVRDEAGWKTDVVAGATIDLLAAVSDTGQFDFEVSLIPWKRCVSYVTNYNGGASFEMFIDATENLERTRAFAPTDVIYRNFQGLYFSKNRYPDGVDGYVPEDLAGKTMCGLLGHAKNWLKKTGVDVRYEYTSSSLAGAFRRLSYQRCDFLGFSPQLVEGWLMTSRQKLPVDIDYVILPWIVPSRFHYWVSRRSARHGKIVEAINNFVRFTDPGAYEKIFHKHLNLGSGFNDLN